MNGSLALMSDEEVARYGREADAGHGALASARGVLPLVAMEVDARVTGVVAAVELTQRFVNTTGAAIEATYIFPLPDRAAVHRFRMEVAGRVIEGAIDERGAARTRYDQAIAAGHRAAIAEEERAGVFSLRVGNLMPGETATVQLSLIGALPIDDGEVTFRFPLVVAPRYIPGAALAGDQAGLGRAADTDLVPDASRISPPVQLPGYPDPVRLALRVALCDGVMRDVASSLHAVVVARRDAQVVELQPGERLDRDFVLRWRIDGDALRSTLVCADDAGGGGGTFALTLVPPSTAAVAARPRDVVFVLDRSGSMEGWKMVAARRAAARMLDSLTSRDRFSALAFDTGIEAVPAAGVVDATDRQRFRAVEALARLEARGGTELAAPLARAISSLAGGTADRERMIVLVTDGQVGNEDDILRRVAPELRNIKMFTLGIDQAVNAAFLRRLAAAGGGLCELVESEDRLDAVMAKVHRRIGTPIATELALQATGLDVDRTTLAPAKLPDVYAGAPVVIFGRYRGAAITERAAPAAGASITVEGTSLGEPLRMTVAASAATGASWLAASWARAHLRDLEDRYAAGARELESQIVRVSKQFGVLSRFTAFVAIDRSEVANKGGGVRQVVQPVELPSGWTATGDAPLVGGLSGQGRAMRAMAAAGPPVMYGGAQGIARSLGMSPATRGESGPSDLRSFDEPPEATEDSDQIEESELELSGYAEKLPAVTEKRRGRPSGLPPAMPAPAPLPPNSVGALPPASIAPSRQERSAPSTINAMYLRMLLALSVQLHELARGSCEPAAVRLVRQRLVQWIEDLRSVGGDAQLAQTVEALVAQLSAALVANANAAASLAAPVAAIADELAAIAVGGRQPPGGRPAFWK